MLYKLFMAVVLALLTRLGLCVTVIGFLLEEASKVAPTYCSDAPRLDGANTGFRTL